MPERTKTTPEVIEDGDLDDATGGIGMLLPAVQKVSEAAITDGTSTPVGQSTTATGISVRMGDGSVRTL